MNELTSRNIYLKQHEFDALVSLCFNAGVNTLTRDRSPKFNAYLLDGKYDPAEVKEHFATYVYQNGTALPGLVKRREAEANMFSHGIYDSTH